MQVPKSSPGANARANAKAKTKDRTTCVSRAASPSCGTRPRASSPQPQQRPPRRAVSPPPRRPVSPDLCNSSPRPSSPRLSRNLERGRSPVQRRGMSPGVRASVISPTRPPLQVHNNAERRSVNLSCDTCGPICGGSSSRVRATSLGRSHSRPPSRNRDFIDFRRADDIPPPSLLASACALHGSLDSLLPRGVAEASAEPAAPSPAIPLDVDPPSQENNPMPGPSQERIQPPQSRTDTCLVCMTKSKRKDFQFCSTGCGKNVAAKPHPTLLRVPVNHVMDADSKLTCIFLPCYRVHIQPSVRDRFAVDWKSDSPLPNIEAVFLVTWPQSMRTSFQTYRYETCSSISGFYLHKCPSEAIIKRGKVPIGQPAERKFFAYERRKCHLGEGDNLEPCDDTGCGLCQAMVTGFRSSLERNRTRVDSGQT